MLPYRPGGDKKHPDKKQETDTKSTIISRNREGISTSKI